MEFYATICRLCEASDKIRDKWLDLFSKDNEQLQAKIQACTSIKIHENDRLPKRICGRCYTNLQQAYNFKLQCEIADAKLRHEIEFLEKNNWNARLSVPPLDYSRFLHVKDESTPKQETVSIQFETEPPVEPIFIKSEEPEEEVPVDVHQFLANDDQEADFHPPKVEIQLTLGETQEGDEDYDDDRDEQSSLDRSEGSDTSEASDQETSEAKECSKKSDEDESKPRVNVCETCGEQFEKSSELYAHSRTVHGKKRFQCNVCSKWFARKSRLRDHEVLHSGVRQFECSECGRRYATQQGLKTHMEDVHSEDLPYVCDKCGKAFSKESKLRLHYTVHIDSRNFLCGVCSKGFKTQAHLNLHMNMHLPKEQKKVRKRRDRQKICICPFCGKVSNSLGTHTMHIRTHTGEQRYECHVCYKKFTSSGSHKKHLRVHSGEKPFVCEFCNKAFRQKHHMTTHIRGVHTNEKPYQCKYCPKAFATRGNMTLHERSHGGPDATAMVAAASSTFGIKPDHMLDEFAAEVSMNDSQSQSSSMVDTSTPSPMLNPGVMIAVHPSEVFFNDPQ